MSDRVSARTPLAGETKEAFLEAVTIATNLIERRALENKGVRLRPVWDMAQVDIDKQRLPFMDGSALTETWLEVSVMVVEEPDA